MRRVFHLSRLTVVSGLFLAVPGAGQSLKFSSGAGAPGETVALEISLSAAPGQAPSALKWDVTFPAQLVEVAQAPEIAKSAADSGKSLACHQRLTYSYICIMAGGQKPIGSGAIAIFRFKILPDAHSGSSAVRLERIEAVTKDLETVRVTASDGQIDIR
jgi:hypothetical protein